MAFTYNLIWKKGENLWNQVEKKQQTYRPGVAGFDTRFRFTRFLSSDVTGCFDDDFLISDIVKNLNFFEKNIQKSQKFENKRQTNQTNTHAAVYSGKRKNSASHCEHKHTCQFVTVHRRRFETKKNFF